MKTICHKKYILFFLFIVFLGQTGQIHAEDRGAANITRTKEVVKDFTTNNNTSLEVDNRYGNITVTHWNKPQVNIRVVIESKAKNQERAEAGLDRVHINMQQKGNTISASTSFSNTNNKGGNEQVTVNYYINGPADLMLKLEQRYGNIYLPEETNGDCKLIVKYGNIQAGSFSNPLTIDAAYSNINLKNGTKMKMTLAYCSDTKFNNVDELTINAKYSGLKGDNIHNLKVDKSYTNMTIKEANKLSLTCKYGNTTLNKLTDEIKNADLSYSNLTIREVSSSFKNITASASYGNVTLSIPENTAFTIEAKNMKYGSFKMKNFNATHTHVETPNYYKYQINGGGNSYINFNGNNYSNITINKQ